LLLLDVFCCTSSEFVSAGMSFAEHENAAKMSPIQKMFVDVQQPQWVCFLLQLLAPSGSKP
jgi:hypothetical protein